jgi:hypothetical protein
LQIAHQPHSTTTTTITIITMGIHMATIIDSGSFYLFQKPCAIAFATSAGFLLYKFKSQSQKSESDVHRYLFHGRFAKVYFVRVNKKEVISIIGSAA